MYVKKMCSSGVGGVTFLLNYMALYTLACVTEYLKPVLTMLENKLQEQSAKYGKLCTLQFHFRVLLTHEVFINDLNTRTSFTAKFQFDTSAF